MSIEKTWQLAPSAPPAWLKKFPHFPQLVNQLLFNRNLTSENAIAKFFNPDYKTGLYDPFLMLDMKKTVDRIFKAIKKSEKIIIFGDYDADGVTSSALLYKTLKFLNIKKVQTYIPHRQKEGYGLNEKIIKKFIRQKINLIITVDCGISNFHPIQKAKEGKIDVIVTDHHEIPEKLPRAFSILNPKRKNDPYPFKNLAGVGVVFKLVQALLKQNHDKTDLHKEVFEKWLLDLVAIGTIADLSPLLDENRVLVKYGLIILNQTKNQGLQKIFQNTRLNPKISPLTTYNVGYQIAPRINAAGRLDHANIAYDLLLASSYEQAEGLAQNLESQNHNRQKLTQETLKQAKEQIINFGNKKILLASHPNWSSGIAGLVAGRICDEYFRPTLIIERGKKESKGSARSIDSFNITEALAACSDILIRYGGHKTAAGFTLETKKISLFYQRLEEIAGREIDFETLKPTINIEAEIKPMEVNWNLLKQIDQFQPFGEKNTVPMFLMRDLIVLNIWCVGAENKHLKLKLSAENKYFEAIGFGLGNLASQLIPGDNVDIVFELTLNEWNGRREIQFKIQDLKLKSTKNVSSLSSD